mmetsp:Transcript_31780/g.64684  ORF Transcript_31780/g.64684 Transcript_31780/m.64684 type:complete len:276 (+) Transcript_31780:247-1074(+)
MPNIPQGPVALFPIIVMTVATILSVITITTCNLVEYDNPNANAQDASSVTRTAGLFCGDGYDSNVFGTIWSSAVVNTARVFAIGAAICGGCTTIGLYPICCQRYNRCARMMMCCICVCCFPAQLMTLVMLRSEFCWDWQQLTNHCSVDWGGVVCIVAAVGWLLGAISFVVLPHHAVERPPKQPKPQGAAAAATAPTSNSDPEVGTTTITETVNPDGSKETKKVTVGADGTKTIEITKVAAGKDDRDYESIPIATNVVPVPVPAAVVPSAAKVEEP